MTFCPVTSCFLHIRLVFHLLRRFPSFCLFYVIFNLLRLFHVFASFMHFCIFYIIFASFCMFHVVFVFLCLK